MRFLLFLLLLSTTTYGQLFDTSKVTVISGLKDPQVLGNVVLSSEYKDVKLSEAGLIKVNSEAKTIIVEASDANRDPINVESINKNTFIVVGNSKVWIEIQCIDFGKEIYDRGKAVIDLSSTPKPDNPKPDDPKPDNPTPSPVPPDQFDNIGQRVATWTRGLPSNKLLADAYKKGAQTLRSDPTATINAVALSLNDELSKIPNYGNYSKFITEINQDFSKRWPMSKGVLADYYTSVAAGLQPAPASLFEMILRK